MIPGSSVPPGLGAAIPYAGVGLDRATERREDPAWVAALVTHPAAWVRPLWRDQCLVAGEPPVSLVLRLAAVDGLDRAELVLLGLDDDGVPGFAVELSDLGLEDALARVGAGAAADIRSLFTGLAAAEAGALAHARGLLYWNRQQRYCGRCGSAAEARHAGHLRACTNAQCGKLLFPRIEPAVITLVETDAAPRRCLLARHPGLASGRLLAAGRFHGAGRVPGGRRAPEIFEEVGVEVGDIGYAGSQPWPFPAGLMVGFRAIARGESVSVDGHEIVAARWFTRAELTEYGAVTGRLGRPDSIDRVMLTGWLAEGEQAPPG